MTHNSTSLKQNWRTPKWLFESVQRITGLTFNVDAASDEDNKLCKANFTQDNSFLEAEVAQGNVVWCNPPFNRKSEFIKKFKEEVAYGVLLLPCDTGSTWFREAYDACSYVIFLTGRVSFCDEDDNPISGNPAPSVLFIFIDYTPYEKVHFYKTQELKNKGELND